MTHESDEETDVFLSMSSVNPPGVLLISIAGQRIDGSCFSPEERVFIENERLGGRRFGSPAARRPRASMPLRPINT